MMPAIDDRLTIDPPPVGDQGRDRVFDAEEHAGRVDRHDPVPGFGAVKILFGAAGDAGIVDQHIELAEMPRGGGHDGGPVLLFRHIKRFEARRGADIISDFSAFVLQHVGDHHLGAFARKHARRGHSHPRCRAGDDCDLACKSHCWFPFCGRSASQLLGSTRRSEESAHIMTRY